MAKPFTPRKKRSKYGAVKTTIHGIKFDSKAEAERYLALKDDVKNGRISDLRLQVPVLLWGRDGPIMTNGGKKQRTWVADFSYVEKGPNGASLLIYEDKKGMPTAEFLLKKAILNAQGVEVKIT